MIRIARVFLVGYQDYARRRKTGDVVDMSMRVVPNASLAQPNGIRDTEVFAKNFLVIGPRHSRIANLHVAEQPLFGDHQ